MSTCEKCKNRCCDKCIITCNPCNKDLCCECFDSSDNYDQSCYLCKYSECKECSDTKYSKLRYTDKNVVCKDCMFKAIDEHIELVKFIKSRKCRSTHLLLKK